MYVHPVQPEATILNNCTKLVVIKDYESAFECRINFYTDTLNDFPYPLADFQPPKSNLFSSTTGVLQKDILVTKSMPF